jgi:ribosomal protein L29
LKAKNALAAELAELKRQGNTSSKSSAEQKQEDEINAQIDDMRQEIFQLREELDKRLSESTQFQQMKRLMQSQSAKVRDLRYTYMIIKVESMTIY